MQNGERKRHSCSNGEKGLAGKAWSRGNTRPRSEEAKMQRCRDPKIPDPKILKIRRTSRSRSRRQGLPAIRKTKCGEWKWKWKGETGKTQVRTYQSDGSSKKRCEVIENAEIYCRIWPGGWGKRGQVRKKTGGREEGAKRKKEVRWNKTGKKGQNKVIRRSWNRRLTQFKQRDVFCWIELNQVEEEIALFWLLCILPFYVYWARLCRSAEARKDNSIHLQYMTIFWIEYIHSLYNCLGTIESIPSCTCIDSQPLPAYVRGYLAWTGLRIVTIGMLILSVYLSYLQ